MIILSILITHNSPLLNLKRGFIFYKGNYMNEPLSIAAVIIAVVGFCVQFGMFVRPVELEKKHREILEESYRKFASLDTVEDIKKDFQGMKCKIDQIYEMLIKREAK
jgi:hypothetical protein